MTVDHRTLLSLLDELMKPISSVKISTQDEEQEQILTINLVFSNACDRFLQTTCSADLPVPFTNDQPAYYRYLQIHLHLLEQLLFQEQQNLSSHLPLFSIQDESIVTRSLSFVTFLGLVLHFDEGIYLSIENYLKNPNSSIHFLKLKTHLTHHDRMHYMHETLARLMKWIRTTDINSSISQRLCSYHLLELILSHLQLLHSPNLKYASVEHSSENLTYLQTHFTNVFIQQTILMNRLLSTTVNSPLWLKMRCGDLLTSILIDSNNRGVRQIFQTILDSATPDDRLYTSMAHILSACPKQLHPTDYLQRIKPQLIELFRETRYMPIVCISINQLHRKYPKLIEEELFPNFLQPLISCRTHSTDLICTEEQLERFTQDIYHLISPTPNESLRIYLCESYLAELMSIHLALEQSLSAIKSQFFQILTTILSSMETDKCLQCVERVLLSHPSLPLKYIPDQESSFSLVVDNSAEDYDIPLFCQLIAKLLFSIENNERLLMKIFLHFLQLSIPATIAKEELIWTANERQRDLKLFKMMELLKCIMEYLSEHMDIVIRNVDDTIRVIQIILDKLTNTYRANPSIKRTFDDDADDLSADNEALQIVFTIASLLIAHYEQLSSENKYILASLYPSLKSIEANHPNNDLRNIARELSVAFVTFGAVKEVSTQSKSNVLIEEVDDERDLRAETFDNALACLSDASVPIRAHGLILFRRLIERCDRETLAKIEENNMHLLKRFQGHLHADDSYEYLAAINVLSALADRCTDEVLPKLCDEYVMRTRKLEEKLKVGEILVKTSRTLGDMSAKYASLLVNTFLNASKQSDDDMYRASALSNLGQLCSVLKYALSKDLSEILIALKSYLSIFESSEVRRASILVCELLCQSLEQSTWLTVLGSELPSFYQLINQLYKSDRDEIVRLHAQTAMEALNAICREYLQPPVVLEKKIRILS